jgi:hypothetical protein
MRTITKAFISVVAGALATTGMASAAYADITPHDASYRQGTLVHGTNTEQTDYTVTGNLGANGPNIVNFTGDTTATGSTSDLLRLQDGSGQADITGAEITLGGTPNDTYSILSGDIYLSGGLGMSWIEFGLTSGAVGTIDFTLTDNLGGTWTFLNQLIGNGDTFYGFEATNGESITNVHYAADAPPGSIDILKQVRIDVGVGGTPGAVPEPGTWALMLLGFGAAGVAMRRSRRKSGLISQLA